MIVRKHALMAADPAVTDLRPSAANSTRKHPHRKARRRRILNRVTTP
jgi:hypothetical protein